MMSIENLKRSIRHFLIRTIGLGILVVLGALSIAHSQRDAATSRGSAKALASAQRRPTAIPQTDRAPSPAATERVPAEREFVSAPSLAERSTDETYGSATAWGADDTGAENPGDTYDTGTDPPADFSTEDESAAIQTVAVVGSEGVASSVATAHETTRNPLRPGPMAGAEIPGYLPPQDSPTGPAESAADHRGFDRQGAFPPEESPSSGGLPSTTGPPEPSARDTYSEAGVGAGPPDELSEPHTLERGGQHGDAAWGETPVGRSAVDQPDAEGDFESSRAPYPQNEPEYQPGNDLYRESAASPSAVPGPGYSSSTGTMGDASGSGVPGSREFEGPQSPSLILQKEMPAEVQVGQPARLALRLRNVGQVTASNVVVRDQVPRGARLVKTFPASNQDPSGTLQWNLGAVPPGKEVVVEMHVEPMDEGRIGSVATVSFAANATGSTLVTKPNLSIVHSGPQQVMVGDMVRFSIDISNPGTGTAEHVVLLEDVPAGLSHSDGQKLEHPVGAIRPGETRHLELTLKAVQAGQVENVIMARADGNIQVQHMTQLEVVAPALHTRIEGPGRRFLNRNATYTVMLENPGSAAANNVDTVVQLPHGLQFVNTNNAGYYDAERHAIRWNLASLPAKKRGRVQFTVVPTQMGDFPIQVSAQADQGLNDRQEHRVHVDGVPALLFSVADATDPVEIGGVTSYEIRVVNQGSKVANNVRLVATLPEGLEATAANGATDANVSPSSVEFQPVAQLVPQQEVLFRVDVRGVRDGDWRFAVNLSSDETTTPVTKQESTHVYSDQ